MRKIISLLLAVIIVSAAFALCGCSKNDDAGSVDVQVEAAQSDPVGAEPAKPADTGRQDGERFEAVIMIEGMEETVRYEHIKNTKVGIELDYDYESLNRVNEGDRETFTSVYDDQAAPDNYMYIVADTDDPDTAAGMFGMTLSFDFEDVSSEKVTLDKAGECVLLYAKGPKSEVFPSDAVEKVYVIPAPDGCRIARIYGTLESAEGFGVRFAEMLDTLEVIPVE